KMPEAERAYVEALGIRRKLSEKNPDAFLPDVAMTLNNLGVFYETLKNYPKALDHYEVALRTYQTNLQAGKIHFLKDWVQVFSNISEVKDSTEAKQLYTLTTRAGLLIAVSCDSLKVLDESIFNQCLAEYGSVSWWAVFAKDYALAEQAGLRAIALDETQTYIWTNIGHACYLNGQEAEAKKAWLHLKGQKDANGRDYKEVLEEDWQALEAAGVVLSGAFDAAQKWLEKEW
ncbi:MAG: tetratricopeptide repeat protein, partial [Saprospiraceae bacterium]|nr:tetratricopeptide repeat protein [Saprospiraceae bacterium]